MKIGIITLGFHYNYGGILQAYAMQTVLNSMGHKASVICYSSRSKWRNYLGNLKWKLSKLLKKPIEITDKTSTFPLYHVSMSYFKGCSEIKENDFGAYVVGSDQVWRKEFVSDFSLSYLLFTDGWNVKRIAYAPSFGPAEWKYAAEETSLIKASLEKFDGLSVREQSGAVLCRNNLGLEAKVVLDPTLLFSQSIYRKFVSKSKACCTPFVYFVKRNLALKPIESIMSCLGELNFSHVYLPYEDYDCGVLPSVNEWLSSICNAKFVLTDSFHACVFSILFHKPFLAMPNKWGGSSRFDSLLRPLGLEYRIISAETQNYQELLEKEIDWEEVERKLDALRQDSLLFLKNALEK